MTHDVVISFAKNGTEFTNLRNGYLILDQINECSDADWASKYGGYIPAEKLDDIISMTMFHKPPTVVRYSHHPKMPHVINCLTPSQEKMIERIIERMEKKKIIVYSKSRKMIKPTMTADEWLEKMEKGELQ